MNTRDRFRGCLLGLATGDAVGTTVEFQPRGTFEPVTDMLGGEPFHLQPGQWTDDTSMALCLATSLIEQRGFDAEDQMKRYCDWYENGYLSSTGKCFDIGVTTRHALARYRETGNPFAGSTDPQSAGNGSLMRLAPVPMFGFGKRDLVAHFSGESSRTTHGAAECVDACSVFGEMIFRALEGASKQDILFTNAIEIASPAIQSIVRGDYRDKQIDEIHGSGYVVKSLQAALWCFFKTESFEQAILTAANLGDDADTTAAICGQLAGAHYGESGIPAHWRARVTMRDEIRNLADRLYRLATEIG
ncbi:MAG: ADP-ribosylglycohydrolase family protein [Chloroflexi bacterium]|nr:ADP-ribosylglycohydrolase family protein [Chloroflexota bacterium]